MVGCCFFFLNFYLCNGESKLKWRHNGKLIFRSNNEIVNFPTKKLPHKSYYFLFFSRITLILLIEKDSNNLVHFSDTSVKWRWRCVQMSSVQLWDEEIFKFWERCWNVLFPINSSLSTPFVCDDIPEWHWVESMICDLCFDLKYNHFDGLANLIGVKRPQINITIKISIYRKTMWHWIDFIN